MTNYLTATIAVTPLVRKLLQQQFRVEPFMATDKTGPIGTLLFSLLGRYTRSETPKEFDRLTASLTIGIPKSSSSGIARKIPALNVLHFNDIVRQTFFETFFHQVDLLVKHGTPLHSALEEVLSNYQLTEDEFPLETATRYFYRYRNRKYPNGTAARRSGKSPS